MGDGGGGGDNGDHVDQIPLSGVVFSVLPPACCLEMVEKSAGEQSSRWRGDAQLPHPARATSTLKVGGGNQSWAWRPQTPPPDKHHQALALFASAPTRFVPGVPRALCPCPVAAVGLVGPAMVRVLSAGATENFSPRGRLVTARRRRPQRAPTLDAYLSRDDG